MTRRALFGDRRGNVVVLTGALILILIGTVGLAVDATRAWMVRARLATALDAAALSAARAFTPGMTAAQLDRIRLDACGVFWSNFGRPGNSPCGTAGGALDTTTFNTGYLGATATNPVVADPSTTEIVSISANATLNTTFLRLLGINSLPIITASAAASRAVTALEVALALDVTGSMNPVATGSSVSKIEALRVAARNFVDTVYNGSETRERVWVSVVPYTSNVNLGTSAYARNMVTQSSLAQFTPGGQPLRDTRGDVVPWAGCVQVRFQPMGGTTGDLIDTPPLSDATRYTAWFYPSSLDNASPPRSRYWRQDGPTRRFVAGDNDWRSFIPGNAAVNERAINEWALNQNTFRGADDVTGGTTQDPLDITGPNLGCLLHSRYAILPLTAERTTIRNRISALFPDPWAHHGWLTNRNAVQLGGTTVHVGLHAAWTTISPNWRGLWSDTPQPIPLPLATADAGSKAIVLMTDGVNTLVDISNRFVVNVPRPGLFGRGAPGPCEDTGIRNPRRPVACPTQGTPNYVTISGYGPYGRWSEGNLRITTNGFPTGGAITAAANATPELDRRLARLCTNIKQSGISIYVVGFDIASAGTPVNTNVITALLTACANSPEDYFNANDATALNNAFISIANRVSRLRRIQ